jgi:hypothetical protein
MAMNIPVFSILLCAASLVVADSVEVVSTECGVNAVGLQPLPSPYIEATRGGDSVMLTLYNFLSNCGGKHHVSHYEYGSDSLLVELTDSAAGQATCACLFETVLAVCLTVGDSTVVNITDVSAYWDSEKVVYTGSLFKSTLSSRRPQGNNASEVPRSVRDNGKLYLANGRRIGAIMAHRKAVVDHKHLQVEF